MKKSITASREEVLRMNDCFAQHLVTVQRSKYKPSSQWKEGQSIILDDSEEVKVLTKEKANELNREEEKYFHENKDNHDSKEFYKWRGSMTLVSAKKDSKEYLSDIANSLMALSSSFGDLIVMGDWNTPWLNQENSYAPVDKAVKFLSGKIDKDFNGGFVLSANEIFEFITPLFWIVRCNASLSEIMMTFKNSKTILGICKYGVLHLEFYEEEERKKMMKFFHERQFVQVENCNDPVYFDDFEGRELLV